MKKAIYHGSLPAGEPAQQFQLAKDAGFEGIEISACESREDLQILQAAAQNAGLEIHSIMAGTGGAQPLSSPDQAARETTEKHIAFAIEQAQIVGADTVLVIPGVVNSEVSYEQAWQRSLPHIKNLAPLAEKANVTIAIENVWNKFLLSPLEFRRYIEDADSTHVKAYFDCGNILLYGFPDQWIASLGALIQRVHVKDFRLSDRNFSYLLQGDVPWKNVMAALRATGYDGYLTVENEVPPYPSAPEQTVFDASNALDRILKL